MQCLLDLTAVGYYRVQLAMKTSEIGSILIRIEHIFYQNLLVHLQNLIRIQCPNKLIRSVSRQGSEFSFCIGDRLQPVHHIVLRHLILVSDLSINVNTEHYLVSFLRKSNEQQSAYETRHLFDFVVELILKLSIWRYLCLNI